MAAKSLLLVPVTLCLLLVLPAQAREANVAAIFYGKAQCKNNPSMMITNATLHLMINKTIVPGVVGRTTETGRIEMRANLNSSEQAALMNNSGNDVFIIAPPHACGAPELPAGTMVAAPVNVTAVISGGTGSSDQDTPVSVEPAAIAASDLVVRGNKGIVAEVLCFICTAFGGGR